jgi:pimeloyl-ACP methyl ester carboxylesterase
MKEIQLRNTQSLLPEKFGFKTQYFNLPGLRLHAALAGPKTGKPVILLHGFPEFWAGWKKQIGPLAEAGYRVIVPDQRGYNLSDKPKGVSAYRLDLLAKDVVNLMDALGYEKTIVVGHDWGGVVAWAVAVLYPERVERLAVLDAPYPPVIFQNLRANPGQLLKSYYMFLFQLPAIPEALLQRQDWKRMVNSMKKTSPPNTFTLKDFDYYQEAWSQAGALTAMLNWYRALFRHPAKLPAKPRLGMPTLLLWGGQDFALGRELAEASIQLCEQGELVVFDKANHWIQHEQAAEVNRRLLQFFG